jgi:hypothetical protein
MQYLRFNINAQNLNLVNLSYEFFKDIWKPVAKKLEFKLNYDDFLRSDVAHLLVEDGEPAALVLASFFDLRIRACFDHSYFQKFPKGFTRQLRSDQCNNWMSFEYLTTKKCAYRMELAYLILGLSFKSLDDLKAQRAICLTRDDVGINKIVQQYGYETFKEAGMANGLPTSYHIAKAYKKNQNLVLQKQIDHLWSSRIDRIEEETYEKRNRRKIIEQVERAS